MEKLSIYRMGDLRTVLGTNRSSKAPMMRNSTQDEREASNISNPTMMT